MKRILTVVLALMIALSLAACGGNGDGGKETTPAEVDMTAQEIMDKLKADLEHLTKPKSDQSGSKSEKC